MVLSIYWHSMLVTFLAGYNNKLIHLPTSLQLEKKSWPHSSINWEEIIHSSLFKGSCDSHNCHCYKCHF